MSAIAEPYRTPRDRWIAIGLGALLVAPFVVSAVLLATAGTRYRPGFDNALIELRVRDAFDHLVTTGPYSRFGWYHPGPMLFYLYALPYRLSGESSRAIPVTALLVNALTVGVVAWVGYRIRGLAGVVWVAIPTALLVRSLGADLLHSPWNPDVSILPLLAVLVAAWAVAAGRWWMLTVAVVFGSFVVQNHVGDALPVAAALVVAIGIGWWRPEERSEHPGRRRALVVAAIVVGVLWVVPVWGDVVSGNGNLRTVAGFALRGGSDDSGERVGGLEALRVVGAQWGPRPAWMLTSARDLPYAGAFAAPEARWWLPLGVLPALVLSGWALLRRRWLVIGLAAIVGAGYAVAVFSVASMRGLLYSYLVWWVWALGAATGILTLAGLWTWVESRRHGPPRWLRPVGVVLAAVVLVAVGVSVIDDAAHRRTPSDTTGLTVRQQQASVGTVADGVIAAVRRGRGPVVLDTTRGVLDAPGLALALERAGIPVRVRYRDWSVPYGLERVWRCGSARAELLVYSGDDVQREHPPRGRRVARWSEPYPAAERRQLALERYALLQQPAAPVRDRRIEELDTLLNGPKYAVEVYDAGPVRKRCPR